MTAEEEHALVVCVWCLMQQPEIRLAIKTLPRPVRDKLADHVATLECALDRWWHPEDDEEEG